MTRDPPSPLDVPLTYTERSPSCLLVRGNQSLSVGGGDITNRLRTRGNGASAFRNLELLTGKWHASFWMGGGYVFACRIVLIQNNANENQYDSYNIF
jgi:hypothetical protein